jgi:hypothetical protein
MATATAIVEQTEAPALERELAYRRNGALDIYLLWHPADDTVMIRVEDLRTGVLVERGVARRIALKAFHHPFTYAP